MNMDIYNIVYIVVFAWAIYMQHKIKCANIMEKGKIN